MEVLSALGQFGETDNLYPLLNEYQIKPWETWTINQKVIHAPGRERKRSNGQYRSAKFVALGYKVARVDQVGDNEKPGANQPEAF